MPAEAVKEGCSVCNHEMKAGALVGMSKDAVNEKTSKLENPACRR